MEETTLIKFLNGTASQQEEIEVLQWLKKPESKIEFDSILEKYFEIPAPLLADNTDYDQLLDSIHKKIYQPKVKPREVILPLVYRSLRIAASIALVAFLGYAMVEVINYKENLNAAKNVAEVSTTIRTTGPGEKLTLLMPDKTKITVNALSEVSFDSDYGKSDRTVRIKGEAYFDVASDPNRPFKVLSNRITTTALGTEFNVFTRKNDIQIALVEGKVAVMKAEKSIELTPGLMAILNSDNSANPDFLIETFDLEKITGWKQGQLTFDRKPLGEILKDLEKWYGVTIKAEEGIDLNSRLIGSYTNKNLEDILTGLSFSLDFNFTITGKNVQLTTKKI